MSEKWNIDYDSGFNSGMEWEQSRIIKLLENEKCKPNDHDYNGGCNCDVIRLIKGEK